MRIWWHDPVDGEVAFWSAAGAIEGHLVLAGPVRFHESRHAVEALRDLIDDVSEEADPTSLLIFAGVAAADAYYSSLVQGRRFIQYLEFPVGRYCYVFQGIRVIPSRDLDPDEAYLCYNMRKGKGRRDGTLS